MINKIKINFILLCCILFTSCAVVAFYQVQEVSKVDKSNNDLTKFENNDLTIEYDFNSRNGYSDFKIFNHSDSLISIDLELTHFLLNDYAFPYYTNKVEINSNSLLLYSSTNAIKTERSSLYSNSKLLILPPKTYKMINGFNVSELYKACDFKMYNDSTSLIFNKETTPTRFGNVFYYTKGFNSKTYNVFKNDFWISKITNLSHSKFTYWDYKYKCGAKQNNGLKVEFNKYSLSNFFYIKYLK